MFCAYFERSNVQYLFKHTMQQFCAYIKNNKNCEIAMFRKSIVQFDIVEKIKIYFYFCLCQCDIIEFYSHQKSNFHVQDIFQSKLLSFFSFT